LSANKNDFSKILILVDGSQRSINAADSAITLAEKRIEIVAVLNN
jgi:hypothetical protein